jgi:glycosyltransferase involved in cell wall biosynthesis
MSPRHVLFVTSSLCVGGAERHTIVLANGIDPARFRSSLIYLKAVHALLPLVDRDRVSVQCCNGRSGFDRRVLRQLAAFIKEQDVEVAVAADPYSLMFLWLARALVRRPVRLVLVFHTTILRSRKEKAQMRVYRWLTRACDRLIYVCDNQRRYWQQHGLRARQSLVIHNGIDAEHFAPGYSGDNLVARRVLLGFQASDYVIGMCAAFRPEKAHGDLLSALALLAERGVNAKAILIGDGAERDKIEAYIRELGLQDRVVITGFQSDVRPYIALCNVMVLPSNTIETFSIAALESMALGKPLILSDVGGASEQVTSGANGFLFPPGDINQLASHLETLSDPSLQLAMGRRAVALVRERFTLQRMLRSYSSVLGDLATEHEVHSPQLSPKQALDRPRPHP